MKKIVLIILIAVGVLCTVRCDDPYMDEKFAAYEELPIGLWLESQPEFSSWVELLKKTGLYDAINIGTKFTCFVADNNAVAEYLKGYGWNSVAEMDSTKASLLIRYHLIADIAYKAKDFVGQLANKTLSGDYISANTQSGGYNGIYINQQAKVIRTDLQQLNGIVHQLNQVLSPVMETTWDLLSSDRYTIFREAAEACRLDTLLSRYERKLGDIAIRDYKTVFVVSDSVYHAKGIYSAENLTEHLKQKYGISDGEKLLREYMYYHVITEFADFRNLGTFDQESDVKVRNLNTYNTTQLVSVADVKSHLVFNRNGDESNVQLVEGHYDVLANNGYMHEVDGLLYVTIAEAAVTSWELTDYDVFRALDLYRKWSNQVDGQKYSLDRVAAEQEGIRWSTIPDDNDAVRYYLRANQWFEYNDAISMSLGFVGWVEYRTPVIAKGKYKITMKYLGYNARGTGRFYFDGIPFAEWAFTSGYTKEIGTIEFSEQSSHVFKVVVVKKGDMEIDQLIFKPVK